MGQRSTFVEHRGIGLRIHIFCHQVVGMGHRTAALIHQLATIHTHRDQIGHLARRSDGAVVEHLVAGFLVNLFERCHIGRGRQTGTAAKHFLVRRFVGESGREHQSFGGSQIGDALKQAIETAVARNGGNNRFRRIHQRHDIATDGGLTGGDFQFDKFAFTTLHFVQTCWVLTTEHDTIADGGQIDSEIIHGVGCHIGPCLSCRIEILQIEGCRFVLARDDDLGIGRFGFHFHPVSVSGQGQCAKQAKQYGKTGDMFHTYRV